MLYKLLFKLIVLITFNFFFLTNSISLFQTFNKNLDTFIIKIESAEVAIEENFASELKKKIPKYAN